MNSTIIAHIDMDAFFASVEERDKPWLKGLPISVGSDPKGGLGRGVVSTANYAARVYGLHSALPIRTAWRYSENARKQGKPSVAFITPSIKKYSTVSHEIMNIVKSYAPTIQVTSIDEAYIDLSYCVSFAEARKEASNIKKAIKKKVDLTCSIGVGSNKMIAKIASDFNKPDGLTVIGYRDAKKFLGPLSIRVIPGVGPKAGQKLLVRGVKTIKELQEFSEKDLIDLFGKNGMSLYKKACGEGSVELTESSRNKSIGERRTFQEDTLNLNFVMKCLGEMSEDIHRHLLDKEYKGFRTVVATIRFSDFETKTRSLTSPEILSTVDELESKGLKLILPFFDKSENPKKKLIRMIGLRVEKLE